ncbi:MAG TPA: right-handed parallel beta-helix repeat-containing protein [Verrucomicrobiales bacterium]|nr:right-handed parallel beta-helix repeat-containing protein [Verrucomicrobiales bacterium]
MSRSLYLAVVIPALLLPMVAGAVQFYVTPEGAGRKDGSGWKNAAGAKALETLVNERMQPGDELLLGGGTYKDAALRITKGGAANMPKTITGVDRGGGLPALAGEWSENEPEKGATAVRIGAGVSHVTISGLRLSGWVYGVTAEASAEPRTHLSFRNVDMERFRYGFFLADCDDLLLEGCDLKRYTKHAFRFPGGCDRATLRQCTADCSEGDGEWEKKTELLPFGFLINNTGRPNTSFVFEDCAAQNNLMPLQTAKYKNGDGFVVEENAAEVTFVRCRALRNQDGGFDVKVRGASFTGCVALDNGRGFRVWKNGTLENCFAGRGASGLWCNGGPVTARRCTFHALKDAAVLMDDNAVFPVTLEDCIVSECGEIHRSTGKGRAVLKNCVTEEDPKYAAPNPAWTGTGGAMDSRAFPDKGYHGAGKGDSGAGK